MHDRSLLPGTFLSGEALTRAMVTLGLRFAAAAGGKDENIEDVLLAASWAGAVDADLRVLSVLTTWLGVHHEVVNVDRLTRVVRGLEGGVLRAYWVGVGEWLSVERKDARWRRLAASWIDGERIDLIEQADFHLRRRGEDPRFVGGPLRVPREVLRDRRADVDTPEEVARRHAAYRARVMMGPRYRADMWAVLDRDSDLSAAAVARQTYGSYATAVDVKRRHALLEA